MFGAPPPEPLSPGTLVDKIFFTLSKPLAIATPAAICGNGGGRGVFDKAFVAAW